MIEPWLSRYLPEGGTLALDIGANVGTWATWLAETFEQVHVFEPHPDLWAGLTSLGPNIAVLPVAVGDRCGLVDLRLYDQTVHASIMNRTHLDAQGGDEQRGTAPVPILSLDGAGYDGKPVDFIKIDTEGYEGHVLRGAVKTLQINRPELLIEVHWEGAGEFCATILEQLGYQVTRIPHPHRGVPAGHHWLHAT